MKSLLPLALLCLSACHANTGARTAQAAPICLASYQIERTDVTDDSDILFTMQNRTVYRNHLLYPCPGLKADTRGFTYEPTDPATDEICSNLVTIRLNTFQSVCQLATFVKLPQGVKLPPG